MYQCMYVCMHAKECCDLSESCLKWLSSCMVELPMLPVQVNSVPPATWHMRWQPPGEPRATGGEKTPPRIVLNHSTGRRTMCSFNYDLKLLLARAKCCLSPRQNVGSRSNMLLPRRQNVASRSKIQLPQAKRCLLEANFASG